MSYYVRLMRSEDVAQVAEIDREAFPTQWPAANYQNELQNRLAHYIVACDEEKKVDQPEVEALQEGSFSSLVTKVRRLFNHDRFFGNGLPPSGSQYIAGFIGFWLMSATMNMRLVLLICVTCCLVNDCCLRRRVPDVK